MGTNYYNLTLSTGPGNMGDVKNNITDNFKKLASRNDITVIPAGGALPQSGSYEVGDRVYRDDPMDTTNRTWPSNYLLIAKDSKWGYHWRPIQHVISPWVDVPATVISDSNYEIHPTYKFQVALDSKGYCFWRGAVRAKTAGALPVATSVNVLYALPPGIRPATTIMFPVAVGPVTDSSTGKAGNISGRIVVGRDGFISFRWFGTNNGVSRDVWLGSVRYPIGAGWFTSA